MKKIFLTTILILSVIYVPTTVRAQGDDDSGYKCDGQQCISCDPEEADCNPGVCTVFICSEQNSGVAPDSPQITNLEELESVNDPKAINVKGVGAPNSKVIIFINGDNKYEGNVNSGGVFDVTFNPNLDAGNNYELQAQIIDQFGNESEKSAAINLLVDLTPPEIEFQEIPEFVNFENILLSGNTEALAKVEVFKDDRSIYATGADTNGNFDLLLNLTNGENIFNVVATDNYENSSQQEISLNYDESNSVFLDINQINDNELEISVNEGLINVEMYINGRLTKIFNVENSDKININLEEYTNGGSKTFEFIGVDPVGNKTSPSVFEYSDNSQLIITIIAIFIPLLIIGLVAYLIYIGKIDIKALRKYINSSQTKMDLKDSEKTKDGEPKENVVPENIRKEF